MSALYTLVEAGMRYNGTPVLDAVTLSFDAAQLVAIIGCTGRTEYRGVEPTRWPRRAFARRVAFIPQSLRVEFPFTAEQVALMGRTPHCDGLFESPADLEAVERALAITDTLPFRQRDFRSLSGGERQRVILASAVAQQPETLLLDEPTTFLDLKHQVAIYRLLHDLSRQGMLVVAVTHDLNLAAAFAARIVVLDAGRVVADGAPAEVLAPELIRGVFGVASELHRGPEGRPWIFYGQ